MSACEIREQPLRSPDVALTRSSGLRIPLQSRRASSLRGAGRRQFSDRPLQVFGAADEIGKELFVHIDTAFVLGQVSLVVSPQKDLYVRASCAQRVDERLKYRDPILGSVSLVSKRGESKPVGRTISQIKLTVGLYAFILRVNQTSACRGEHAVEFLP